MKRSLILFEDFCLFVGLFKLSFYIANNTFYYIILGQIKNKCVSGNRSETFT